MSSSRVCVHMFSYHPNMSASGGQNMALDPLGLELQAAVSCWMQVGEIANFGLLEEQQTLFTAK